jgi:hypothetical protein
MEEKKRIAPTLREMKVGDVEKFPAECYTSLFVTISRLQFMRKGMRWSVRRCEDAVKVTRTA